MIGIDLETTGLDPQKDQARFVQIVTEQAVHIADAFTIRHEKIRALVRKCAARGLVAHNTVFEYRWLTEYFEVDPGRNVSGALRPGRGLGRDPAHPCRHGKWSGPQLTDEQIESTPRRTPRSCRSSTRSWGPSSRRQGSGSKLQEAGLWEVYELERRVAYAVDLMERNGFAVREDRPRGFIEQTTEEAERLKVDQAAHREVFPIIRKSVSSKHPPNSPAQTAHDRTTKRSRELQRSIMLTSSFLLV